MSASAKAISAEKICVDMGSLTNAELARRGDAELLAEMAETAKAKEALAGREAQLAGEIARREAFRVEGATSLESYLSGHLGRSAASARALAHVAKRLFDLPALQGALSSGQLSFDQVRSVVDVAEPHSDGEWAEASRGLPVHDLVELAQRSAAKSARCKPRPDGPERVTLRCNDAARTMTAQLPAADYVQLKGTLQTLAASMSNEGDGEVAELAHDERMGLALISLGRSGSPAEGRWSSSSAVVVAHVALKDLIEHEASLRAELQHAGLISAEVVERLACDSTMVVGLDDEAGHTMYEGRAHRFPTETQRRELWRRDRHCRFPGCGHSMYTNAHHIVPWTPAGLTDLENLVTLCRHHHHEVHSKRWSMSGNANVELTFIGPQETVMTSRPSPLWGKVVRSE
jgi:Domain of unknown function (DUF222)/HNH endonuclease